VFVPAFARSATPAGFAIVGGILRRIRGSAGRRWHSPRAGGASIAGRSSRQGFRAWPAAPGRYDLNVVRIRAEGDTARIRERKRDILRAAAEAFRERGYRATSMRHIAASLGMTVGSLYYYFASKPELLGYCQHATLDRLIANAERRRGEDSAAARLTAIIVDHVRCLHDDFPGALAHLTLDPLPERERRPLIERRDRYEALLRGTVVDGQRRGEFRDCDARTAVWTILGALNATASWFRVEGGRSAAELGHEMAATLVRGLLVAPPPAPGTAAVTPNTPNSRMPTTPLPPVPPIPPITPMTPMTPTATPTTRAAKRAPRPARSRRLA
jgi:AcrR family transcriptional regulator